MPASYTAAPGNGQARRVMRRRAGSPRPRPGPLRRHVRSVRPRWLRSPGTGRRAPGQPEPGTRPAGPTAPRSPHARSARRSVLVLLDHPLQAADLPLDTAQPREVVVLAGAVSVHAALRPARRTHALTIPRNGIPRHGKYLYPVKVYVLGSRDHHRLPSGRGTAPSPAASNWGND